jgi:putative glutamine transport system substrate-binding protein
VLSLFVALNGARADGRVDEIRARGKLIVSVKSNANRPHKDPAHFQKRGFEIDLAKAIARRLLGDENKIELRILSRPARLPMLGAGAVDLVISMIPVNPTMQRQYDLSHPYFASGETLMIRQDSPANTLSDVAGKTIAVLKQGFNDHGAVLQRIAHERGVAVTTRYYPSFDSAANAVSTGEAAAMVGNFVDLEAFRKDHPGFKLLGKLLENQQFAVAVKKGDTDLLKVVNATIDDLRKTGDLKQLTDKWQLPYLLP